MDTSICPFVVRIREVWLYPLVTECKQNYYNSSSLGYKTLQKQTNKQTL